MNLPHIEPRNMAIAMRDDETRRAIEERLSGRQVAPKFTHRDALLLVLGGYSAVLFAVVIAWVQS